MAKLFPARHAARFACSISLLLTGCGSDDDASNTPAGVGSSCSSVNENEASFASSHTAEVIVEHDPSSPVVCLYNHFQGRVSCPYGQSAADLGLPETDPKRCRTPAGELVTVEVEPQLSKRRAADAVYQSCRCAGPDPDASYCKCPGDMTCTHLIDTLGATTDLDGSYCIPLGTEYVQGTDYGPECDRSAAPGTPGHCG